MTGYATGGLKSAPSTPYEYESVRGSRRTNSKPRFFYQGHLASNTISVLNSLYGRVCRSHADYFEFLVVDNLFFYPLRSPREKLGMCLLPDSPLPSGDISVCATKDVWPNNS